MYADNWYYKTIKEDANNYYYVGISKTHPELVDAMNEAYNNAVKEAIKHNYGFNQELQENFYQSLENSEVQQSSFINMKSIQVKEVKPLKHKIVKSDKGYMVYRQISYSKNAIKAELKRLKTITADTSIVNEYNKNGANGWITVKTLPANANIQLTKKDGKNSINGMTNGKFNLELGQYNIIITKEGFNTVQRDVIISGEDDKLELKLIPSKGEILVNAYPKDASIFLDGRLIDNNKVLSLMAGEEYKVRVEHPDYFTKEEVVKINNKDYKIKDFDLSPRNSKVSIYTNPLKADVWINGQKVGQSPVINYETNSGICDITVKKVGFRGVYKTIKLKPNKSHKPLNIELIAEAKIKKEVKKPYKAKKNEIMSNIYFGLEKIPQLIKNSQADLIFNDYNEDDLYLLNLGFSRRFSHTTNFSYDLGFNYGHHNGFKYKELFKQGEYSQSYVDLYFGLKYSLFNDLLSITPRYGFFRATLFGKDKKIFTTQGEEFIYEGTYIGLKGSLNIWNTYKQNGNKKFSLSIDYNYRQLNGNINQTSNEITYDLDKIELNDKVNSIGIGFKFYFE